jgi:hypothetical protein
MNEENFTKFSIKNEDQTFLANMTPNFVSSKKLRDGENPLSPGGAATRSFYQVQTVPKSYGCDTCLIEGFFTLDNAKFLYLNYIYNFMNKCLDMSKIHFVEGDTDSMYWAVAGKITKPLPILPSMSFKEKFKTTVKNYIRRQRDQKQGFTHIILDQDFYNENVYKWMPSSFYSTNNSNPKFKTELEQRLFDKKLGGFAIEKQDDCAIAEAPKSYNTFSLPVNFHKLNTNNLTLDITEGISRHYTAKGVRKCQNPLTVKDYHDILMKRTTKQGTNTNLQLHDGEMSKVIITKNVLTAAHTKYRVSSDFSTCFPLKTRSSAPSGLNQKFLS